MADYGKAVNHMTKKTTQLAIGIPIAIFIFMLGAPLWYGVLYGISSALGGLAILLALIFIQYPLMRFVTKRFGGRNRNSCELQDE